MQIGIETQVARRMPLSSLLSGEDLGGFSDTNKTSRMRLQSCSQSMSGIFTKAEGYSGRLAGLLSGIA